MANAPQYDAAPSRPLSRGDIKILSLSALGGALEFYDFIIFVYFATVIGQLFFPPDMPEWLRQIQTFGIFAAGWGANGWRKDAEIDRMKTVSAQAALASADAAQTARNTLNGLELDGRELKVCLARP